MSIKIILFTGLSFLTCNTINAQNKPDTEQKFQIKGQLGVRDTAMTLFIAYRNKGFETSKTRLKSDGSFVIDGVAGYPQKAILYLSNEKKSSSLDKLDQIAIYLQRGTITLKSPDSLLHSSLGGTSLNIDEQYFLSQSKNIPTELAILKSRYQSTTDADIQKQIIKKYETLDDSLKYIVKAFIQKKPNSLVSLHLLRRNFDPKDNVELSSNLFSLLTDSIQKTPSGENYKESIENVNKLAVGKIAPSFEARNIDGTISHLSDYKGKYVLLDFWASWCGPCRKESSNLVNNYSEFKNRNFEIISFSIDKNGEDWKRAVKEDHYNWINLIDSDNPLISISKIYGVDAVPTNYLLDPDGKIIAMNLRGAELKEALQKMVK